MPVEIPLPTHLWLSETIHEVQREAITHNGTIAWAQQELKSNPNLSTRERKELTVGIMSCDTLFDMRIQELEVLTQLFTQELSIASTRTKFKMEQERIRREVFRKPTKITRKIP